MGNMKFAPHEGMSYRLYTTEAWAEEQPREQIHGRGHGGRFRDLVAQQRRRGCLTKNALAYAAPLLYTYVCEEMNPREKPQKTPEKPRAAEEGRESPTEGEAPGVHLFTAGSTENIDSREARASDLVSRTKKGLEKIL